MICTQIEPVELYVAVTIVQYPLPLTYIEMVVEYILVDPHIIDGVTISIEMDENRV